MKFLIYVFIGGGLGSICRYGLGRLWAFSSFPMGSLTANIISSLILGILIGMNSEEIMKTEYKLLLMTGFCGGFSTFSTFSAELVRLFQEGAMWSAITYLTLSIVTGVISILLGIYFGRLVVT